MDQLRSAILGGNEEFNEALRQMQGKDSATESQLVSELPVVSGLRESERAVMTQSFVKYQF